MLGHVPFSALYAALSRGGDDPSLPLFLSDNGDFVGRDNGPIAFPFRDQSCLVRSSQNLTKDMLKMHADDSADDALIAEELRHQAVTQSQTRAVERARHMPLVPPTNDATPLPQNHHLLWQVSLILSHLSQRRLTSAH